MRGKFEGVCVESSRVWAWKVQRYVGFEVLGTFGGMWAWRVCGTFEGVWTFGHIKKRMFDMLEYCRSRREGGGWMVRWFCAEWGVVGRCAL